jgi:hypothetical protein
LAHGAEAGLPRRFHRSVIDIVCVSSIGTQARAKSVVLELALRRLRPEREHEVRDSAR